MKLSKELPFDAYGVSYGVYASVVIPVPPSGRNPASNMDSCLPARSAPSLKLWSVGDRFGIGRLPQE